MKEGPENGSAAAKSMLLEPGNVSGAINNVFGAANNVFWRLQDDCGPANTRFLGSERAPEQQIALSWSWEVAPVW